MLKLAPLSAKAPGLPIKYLKSEGIMSVPFQVVITGISVLLINSIILDFADLFRKPCPMWIIGLLEDSNFLTMSFKISSEKVDVILDFLNDFRFFYSTYEFWLSAGISRRTGPGLPE